MSSDTTAKPFLSAAQMDQIREVAMRGMTTACLIRRKTTSDSAYGDDDVVTWTDLVTVKGWIRSTPTPVREQDTGQVITVNTYRLLVPVGTDIAVGDLVVADGGEFIVSDTTAESTWQAYLWCSLRRRE